MNLKNNITKIIKKQIIGNNNFMKYKCLKSFKSSYYKNYNLGDIIGSYDYNKLSINEKKFFNQIYEIEDSSSTQQDSNPWWRSNDDSDSSSFDFGGGDSGGSGSGEDW